jgi:dTDP-4-dehydrorhamnose 3,5-epimerase
VKVRALSIAGSWEVTPEVHRDERGLFLESFRVDRLARATGQEFTAAQTNLSVSARGVIRGIHLVDGPPGQAKYVTCVSGAILDVVVDLRTGSPTFATWEAVRLDDLGHRAVYLEAGLGHAFCALTDDAMVAYMCSTVYNPRAEVTINPEDPDLAIAWPCPERLLSARDAAAPTVRQALDRGVLPAYAACLRATAP